jgi:predicted CoA-substrate-specific enzyme activase
LAPKLVEKNKVIKLAPDSYHMGLDIGSTTIKVVLFHGEEIVYETYKRHSSDIKGTLLSIIDDLEDKFPDLEMQISITGSGGVLVAQWLGVPFVQEVIAQTFAIQKYHPDADVIIELGGEDAKLTFLKPSPEQRMNGTCAGGTGSFIDQMAQLLQTDAEGLNTLAKSYSELYPIASRCGVFAKSDIQPLLNDGVSKEDLAASVLQAVVIQTIAGLSQGRKIKGNVIFLGGPLFFLSELRKSFERTLEGQVDSFTLPDKAQLFVAIGAALLSDNSRKTSLAEIKDAFNRAENLGEDISHITPLFKDQADYDAFVERHSKASIPELDLSEAKGPLFFGLDAGSTTTKAVLLDQDQNIVFSYYDSNKGSPVKSSLKIMQEIYDKLPEDAYIARSCATGYGESLLKTALSLEDGEIETMAHYKAAEHFLPGVDFIVDIGGQDMKCMRVHDGIIDNIMLNEACSSGCGSFIQTFAHGLNMDVPTFAQMAITAKNPVDLGTRCTVFMNSRVKQAQKEGATVGDISAGLSYSVVRNALYKVIKIRDPEQMGEKIVVQGGTFLNDSILRCFEKITGREVIRPNIAGLMGAFGCALLAQNNWDGVSRSSVIQEEELDSFTMDQETTNCKFCPNHCKLTINTFQNGERHVSGNRCERGAGISKSGESLPNMYDWKYKRTFNYYKPLPSHEAKRGVIGIPRALNIYENYPLWYSIFTHLGFRVQLSGRTSHKTYDKGIDSIPSESVCYPAKLSHGHIMDLIEKGVHVIFYPDVAYEQRENENSNNHFNCPIVTSYPEVIKNNVDAIIEGQVTYINPFVSLNNPKYLAKMLLDALKEAGFEDITAKEMDQAVEAAFEEYTRYKEDILQEGERVLKWIEDNDKKAIVLAGRPYHIDPEINHGIPELINSLGMAVISEEAIARPGFLQRPIRVVDQWMYHTRLYEAAAQVGENPRLELVQLFSFGCGVDAVTTDQVQEILEAKDKIYTCLKIDEVSNLGAARIRLRSLKVAMDERERQAKRREELHQAKDAAEKEVASYVQDRVVFTKEMRKDYTILAPQMAPPAFEMIETVLNRYDYNVKVLEKATAKDVEVGLKYVNNDACYPTILVVGQLMNALLSGEYDVNKTAVFITQTGGGCRATNYVAFIRKALKDANLSQVPVIAISATGIEENPGMTFSIPMLHHAMQAIVLGDLLTTVLLRVRPYEMVEGAANKVYRDWMDRSKAYLSGEDKTYGFNQLVDHIVRTFDEFPMKDIPRKPRVGVVGEILVKFQPDANNNVVGVIEDEGCEAVLPGLLDFFLYCSYNPGFKARTFGMSKTAALGGRAAINIMEMYRRRITKRLEESEKFPVPVPIDQLAEYASTILSVGNATGEGWFLTAEMIELISSGTPNIIMCQPFACLPNHVTGKGMVKAIREKFPQANITPIDYDPGASEVNQLNRIKLMISTAKLNEPLGLDNLKSDEDKLRSQEASAVLEHERKLS